MSAMMKGIDECSYEEFELSLKVGVGAVLSVEAVCPYFSAGACIVNISSSRTDEPAADGVLQRGKRRYLRSDACGKFLFGQGAELSVPGVPIRNTGYIPTDADQTGRPGRQRTT